MPQVLILSSQKTNQLILGHYIYSLGASIFLADNFSEGFELARAHKLTLVIIDYELKEMNGFEVAKDLRKLLPQVEILLILEDHNTLETTYLAAQEGFKVVLRSRLSLSGDIREAVFEENRKIVSLPEATPSFETLTLSVQDTEKLLFAH